MAEVKKFSRRAAEIAETSSIITCNRWLKIQFQSVLPDLVPLCQAYFQSVPAVGWTERSEIRQAVQGILLEMLAAACWLARAADHGGACWRHRRMSSTFGDAFQRHWSDDSFERIVADMLFHLSFANA